MADLDQPQRRTGAPKTAPELPSAGGEPQPLQACLKWVAPRGVGRANSQSSPRNSLPHLEIPHLSPETTPATAQFASPAWLKQPPARRILQYSPLPPGRPSARGRVRNAGLSAPIR